MIGLRSINMTCKKRSEDEYPMNKRKERWRKKKIKCAICSFPRKMKSREKGRKEKRKGEGG